jgi:hypothetical protein
MSDLETYTCECEKCRKTIDFSARINGREIHCPNCDEKTTLRLVKDFRYFFLMAIIISAHAVRYTTWITCGFMVVVWAATCFGFVHKYVGWWAFPLGLFIIMAAGYSATVGVLLLPWLTPLMIDKVMPMWLKTLWFLTVILYVYDLYLNFRRRKVEESLLAH